MLSWFTLPRIPEPEVMDDSAEVEAYASAAAQAYLDKIDDTFVEHALRLVRGRTTGRALDIGTGPGQIVLKLARRPALRDWHFIGVDHSANMIKQARASMAPAADPGSAPSGHGFSRAENGPKNSRALAPEATNRESALQHDEEEKEGRLSRIVRPDVLCREAPEARVQFFIADGNRLPFPSASFDLVMSNSVLHHLAEPQRMLSEVTRLVKPGGAILIRDLRRPSRLAYPLHVRWYGRHYSGLMYQLYCASVRSSYTVPDLEELLRRSRLQGARPFTHHRTHLGIERALDASS